MESTRIHPRRTPTVLGVDRRGLGQTKLAGSSFTCGGNRRQISDPGVDIHELFMQPRRATTELSTMPSDAIVDLVCEMSSQFESMTLRAKRHEPEFSDVAATSPKGTSLFPTRKLSLSEPCARTSAEKAYESDCDSALGSSVISETQENGKMVLERASDLDDGNLHGSLMVRSASVPPSDGAIGLSGYAARKIRAHVFEPIFRQEPLSHYHSFCKSVMNACSREISTLRDIEKILLWTSADFSRSRLDYLNFCRFTIHCVEVTATSLPLQDQKKSADRPYTPGYFMDLVYQLRHYATTLQQIPNPQSDPLHTEDKIMLVGGLATIDQPAELVRVAPDGKAISLRTNSEVNFPNSDNVPRKRYGPLLSEHEEAVLRAMARRKKSEMGLERPLRKCSECEATFERACDLTKHEKTHSRVYKCPDLNCSYAQKGFPTPKELERHCNDRHIADAERFPCTHPACKYSSKRKSNLKQHMEKAHGITYIRAKNVAGVKSRRSSSGRTTTATVQVSDRASSLSSPTPLFDIFPETTMDWQLRSDAQQASLFSEVGFMDKSLQGDQHQGSMVPTERRANFAEKHDFEEIMSFSPDSAMHFTSSSGLQFRDPFTTMDIQNSPTLDSAGTLSPSALLETLSTRSALDFESTPDTLKTPLTPGHESFSTAFAAGAEDTILYTPITQTYDAFDESFTENDWSLSHHVQPLFGQTSHCASNNTSLFPPSIEIYTSDDPTRQSMESSSCMTYDDMAF